MEIETEKETEETWEREARDKETALEAGQKGKGGSWMEEPRWETVMTTDS